MSSLNPYQVLGLSPEATDDEIRTTYRVLARKYHPDVNTAPGAEDTFKELAQAFSVLTDRRRRALYDEFGPASLRLGFDPDEARQTRQTRQDRWTPPPRQTPPQQVSGQPTKADVVERVEISLGLSLRGGQVRVPSPAGRSTIPVTVPVGAQDGSRLLIRGRGKVGRGGGRPGDLIVELRVRPNDHYRRSGLDLHLELPITISEAVRGATIEVPAPGGRLRLRVPPDRQGGEVLRLRGKGLRDPDGGTSGDLVVRLALRLPENTGPVARTLDTLAGLYRRHVREDLDL